MQLVIGGNSFSKTFHSTSVCQQRAQQLSTILQLEMFQCLTVHCKLWLPYLINGRLMLLHFMMAINFIRDVIVNPNQYAAIDITVIYRLVFSRVWVIMGIGEKEEFHTWYDCQYCINQYRYWYQSAEISAIHFSFTSRLIHRHMSRTWWRSVVVVVIK